MNEVGKRVQIIRRGSVYNRGVVESQTKTTVRIKLDNHSLNSPQVMTFVTATGKAWGDKKAFNARFYRLVD